MNIQAFKRSAQSLSETDITVCTRCIYDERVNAITLIRKLNDDPFYVLEVKFTASKDTLICYLRKLDNGRIEWPKSAEDILRLINASDPPYVGACTFVEDKKVVIVDAELVEDSEVFCAIWGQITLLNHGDFLCIVSSGNGKLSVSKFLIENGRLTTSIRARFR